MRTLLVIAVIAAAGGCVRSGFATWLVGSPADAGEDASQNPIVGDLDHDGCVGCADYEILAREFGTSGPGLLADIDGDGIVAGTDFSLLAANWGQGCPETPTSSLALSLGGFEPHIGRALAGTLLSADGVRVTGFAIDIVSATGQITVADHLAFSQNYRLDLYVDLDGDARCGSTDLAWTRSFDTRACDIVLDVAPASMTSRAACASFAITGDVDGDGCVSRSDLDYVHQQIFEASPDPAADVNHDGNVTVSDELALNANMGIGCPATDGGLADGAPGDGAPGDHAAGDAGHADSARPDFGPEDVAPIVTAPERSYGCPYGSWAAAADSLTTTACGADRDSDCMVLGQSWTDVSVQVDVQLASVCPASNATPQAALYTRIQRFAPCEARSTYMCVLDFTAGWLAFCKPINQCSTMCHPWASVVPVPSLGTTYTLRASAIGSQITCEVWGGDLPAPVIVRADNTEPGVPFTQGGVGFNLEDASGAFSHFLITTP